MRFSYTPIAVFHEFTITNVFTDFDYDHWMIIISNHTMHNLFLHFMEKNMVRLYQI